MQYEYKGVVHLHSTYSDGSATVEQIITKAQQAGLDFVLLSDHDTVAAMRHGYEGWHGNTLLLVGNEISPPKNHYLAFGIDEDLDGDDYASPREIMADVAKRGALGIIAHPFGGKSRFFRVVSRSWDVWDADTFDGIEIWSYMIDWIERVNPLTLLYYYLYPDRAIRGPHPDALKKWDEIAQERRVIGVGSTDAHGKPLPIFRFIKFLPYEFLFRSIRTHVLASEPLARDLGDVKWQIYEAIRQGRCFFGHDGIADTTGFRFHGNKGAWIMGDEGDFAHPVNLEVRVPQQAEIRLLRDGGICHQSRSKLLHYRAEQPGVYRVEVSLNGKPWIFSNPLFLRAKA